jgi:hypothetical protein
MSQKNRNTLEVPLPRSMREASQNGYVTWVYGNTVPGEKDPEMEFVSDHELVIKGYTVLDVEDTNDVEMELRPWAKAKYVAHIKFEPVEMAESVKEWQKRKKIVIERNKAVSD